MPSALHGELERLAVDSDFSGVVHVARGSDVQYQCARGYADRARKTPNALTTQFGIASGTKGFTAITVMALVDDGVIALDTPAHELLGSDLNVLSPDVTLYHLLTHTSGVGDYIDESADRNVEVWPYAMPASDLLTTADYTPLIANRPPEFAAGARFEYCDSGYVLLALIAERATGASFYDLARERVFARAAMKASTFLRGDELPPNAAHGYLTDGRTNIANIPCRGSGDGGAFSTVGDLAAFWSALFAGELVPPEVVDEMVRPRHDVPSERKRYGLGFWLAAEGDRVLLEGYDAGVSFRSAYEPSTELQYTVISNTTDGAWPIVRVLDEH